MAVAGARAFGSAIHYDPELFAHCAEIMNCMTLAGDVLSRPGVIERVLEVHGQNPLHVTPGPDRRAPEELLT